MDFYNKFISKSKKNNIYFVSKNEYKKLFNFRKYVNDKLVKLNVELITLIKTRLKKKVIFLVTEDLKN